MTHFAFYRMTEHFIAPLRERIAQGAQASGLWQDKRDSLWLSRAVVLALFVNAFVQAANSAHSLSVSTSRCTESSFFTSSDSCHVS
jgi:hypothetical protein